MSGDASGPAAESRDESVDLSTFEKTLSLSDFATKITVGGVFHPPWFSPIDTIDPRHTVGKGRTNLTLIAPDILQTDTTGTPYASFTSHSTPSGGPGVSVHFEPSAYGITSTATYVVSFLIAASGPVTLNIGGYAGAGTVTGTGSKTVTGNTSVTVVLHGVPASQQTYASIQQTGGAQWSWYSTTIEYPPLVFLP
jgi:hypothetical protein